MPARHPPSFHEIHRVPSVLASTAPNPGPKTLEGTNVYVVGRNPAYIVDPGPVIPSFLDGLAAQLRQNDIRSTAILLTHLHPDHAPGAVFLAERLGVPVYASPSRAAHVGTVPAVDFPTDTLPLDGEPLVVLKTPGHTPDHVAFWLPVSRILLAGDSILGRGSTLIQPPEGDMSAYMHTLARFRELDPRLILPGHGPVVTDPARTLREYVDHRRRRENQVVAELRNGPRSAVQLAHTLYRGVRSDLRPLAIGSLEGTLGKLTSDGLVRRDGTLYTLVDTRPPRPDNQGGT